MALSFFVGTPQKKHPCTPSPSKALPALNDPQEAVVAVPQQAQQLLQAVSRSIRALSPEIGRSAESLKMAHGVKRLYPQ